MDRYRIKSPDGCELAVVECGDPSGAPILFVHGFAGDHTVWERQLGDPVLRAACRLVAFDLRGHGDSSQPVETEAYEQGKRWADDLAAIIAERALARPVLVAWSYGGRVVNDYLRHYGSAALAGLNYVATAAYADPAAAGPAHGLLGALCASDSSQEAAAADAFIAALWQAPAQGAEYRRRRASLDRVPVAIRAALRARPLDYDALFATLDVPVLASHGAHDPFLLPRASERLATTVPRGRYSLFASSAHAPFYDDAPRFNRELLDFVRECRAGRALGAAGPGTAATGRTPDP